ncbi:hypothetical protein INT48_007190 [Thamnidium elegans]|uniref:4-coumarate--CoA ligase n=1 Tax=Thamnidium elegans TaxID=101142 RepID=A0A8H7VWX9_9FUNG|nr:hypothetical protein INT48_007190 [Thamnidium elegans]
MSNTQHVNLSDYILSNGSSFPSSNIVYSESSNDESLSFEQLCILIRQINAGLQYNVGLKKGECVCISSPNNIYIPPIALGVMASGGHITPTNPLFTIQELKKQLVMSKTKYIIAHPYNLDTVLEAAKLSNISKENVWSIFDDPKKRVKTWKEILLQDGKEADSVSFSFEENMKTLIKIFFPVGQPKGVVLSHHNLISAAVGANKVVASSPSVNVYQKILGVIPLFHVFGILSFMLTSLYQGWEVVMLASYDLENVCQIIEKHKINSYRGVPPMLLHLLNNPSIVDKYDLSSLKLILVGAAPVPPALDRRMKEKFNIQVTQGYGMTETSAVMTMQTLENYAPGSVGQMLEGIMYKVVDKDGKEVKNGEAGEICIKSSIVMHKYLENPSATSEMIDDDGFLHTGDIGYVNDLGNWYIVDRTKELIKFNAYQIAPAELEAVLLECPLVSDAAVIGIYDEKKETEVPRAYISLNSQNEQIFRKDLEAITQDLHDFVNQNVIHYKRLRGGIAFIETIPKSVSGKILRKDLRELFKSETNKSKL